MIEEAARKLTMLLQGAIPEKINTEGISDEKDRQFAASFNLLIDFVGEIHSFIMPLSRGELHHIGIRPTNFLASPFKELHSRLLHLTWQTQQIVKGDYSQRIDFMGDFSEAFNSMVISLESKEKALRNKIAELEKALHYIKRLEGILPICANCKKIRIDDDESPSCGEWVAIEKYITDHTEAQFSHSLCPACIKELYPDLEDS